MLIKDVYFDMYYMNNVKVHHFCSEFIEIY